MIDVLVDPQYDWGYRRWSTVCQMFSLVHNMIGAIVGGQHYDWGLSLVIHSMIDVLVGPQYDWGYRLWSTI